MMGGKLVRAFGPMTALGLEFLIAGTILFIAASVRGDVRAMCGHRRAYYLLCGGCWAANMLLFMLGVAATTNPRELVAVGLINYLWPSLTVVFAVLLLKRRASLLLPVGLLLTMVGIVVGKLAISPMTGGELLKLILVDPNLLAYSLVLVCAIAWGLYTNLSLIYATPGLPGAVPLFMIAVSVPFLGLGALTGERMLHSGTALLNDLALVAGWAVLSGSAAMVWDFGARNGKVVLFGSLSMMIPFFSTVLTAWSAEMELSSLVLASGALVMLGSFCARHGVQEA